ncbi:hypothetical protein Ctob_014172 [Chrysochromulina tobinii]|uniref:Uncharacterized protein n=1 Tax=Chrysochromulina tobinii TaxID=1460289 RepID=A0A0M0K4M1_9EUKA|nr:hypothetical protein Ctob_014172 [Chrysochromulina tobinii]|eukprot:KOO33770.1 hypothetical protein Ctob_014172 [Chrysochromulina sp. CCMP291]
MKRWRLPSSLLAGGQHHHYRHHRHSRLSDCLAPAHAVVTLGRLPPPHLPPPVCIFQV